jgi:hypothetical protein
MTRGRSTKAGGGAPTSACTLWSAGSYSSAPCSATTRSNRFSRGMTRRRSVKDLARRPTVNDEGFSVAHTHARRNTQLRLRIEARWRAVLLAGRSELAATESVPARLLQGRRRHVPRSRRCGRHANPSVSKWHKHFADENARAARCRRAALSHPARASRTMPRRAGLVAFARPFGMDTCQVE